MLAGILYVPVFCVVLCRARTPHIARRGTLRGALSTFVLGCVHCHFHLIFLLICFFLWCVPLIQGVEVLRSNDGKETTRIGVRDGSYMPGVYLWDEVNGNLDVQPASSPHKCIALCTATPHCEAWSYHPNSCELKRYAQRCVQQVRHLCYADTCRCVLGMLGMRDKPYALAIPPVP